MKTSMWTILSAVLVSGGLPAHTRQAQELPKPGKQHEVLKQFEGTWDAVAKFAMEPGKPMTESKGVETSVVGLGGFWLSYEYTGEMMGAPYIGRGTLGFDQKKQKYVGTWIDSMKSGLFISEGTGDANGRITLIAQGYCDAAGKSIVMKQVLEFKDKDTRSITFLSPNPDGKEELTGTIEYKRRK